MKNKLVIFDLDGVLIDSRDLHYYSLNNALSKIDNKYIISKDEHLSIFDGLSTTKKLNLLAEIKKLPKEYHQIIWEDKQKATIELLKKINKNKIAISIINELKKIGWKVAVASNSIRETLRVSLHSIGILHLIDYMVSNEDVINHKPHPEMYWKCMLSLNALPSNTLIVEDSHIGRQAALSSGANLYAIKDSYELNYKTFFNELEKFDNKKQKINIPWSNKKMNVLIPMAGAGSRFSQAGYTFPKPLIEVNGKPMIQKIVENLNIDAHYIFIVQKEHYDKYNLKQLLNLISQDCDIIIVDSITEGAACTALLAKEIINDDQPLLIANSDQIMDWNSNECLYAFSNDNIDGGILVFESTHPKWSFVKLDSNNFVIEVAEKNPISNIATTGVYYWSKGSHFVKYAEQMITNNIRVNNEFYICPIFNEAIKDNKKIKIKYVDKMWGIGTPEDLKYYLENNK
jgi:HAD superfamily hydrolase (TIGR01509 family)